MIAVDSSALVADLFGEPEKQAFEDRGGRAELNRPISGFPA